MMVTRPVTAQFVGLEPNRLSPHSVAALKRGQIIDATTVSNSSQGHVKLRIGNSIVSASTSVALAQNSRLLLEVVQVHPQPVLKLIPTAAAPAAAKPLQDAVIGLLSRQAALAPSLSGLIHRALTEGKSSQQQSLRDLAVALANNLPGRQNMAHAEGMRHAFLRSGLFLEAILARSVGKTKTDTPRDIKACLLRLQQGLEHYKQHLAINKHAEGTLVAPYSSVIPPRRNGLPVPQQRVPFTPPAAVGETVEDIPDLIGRAEGAIARLGLLQLITADNFNNGEYMWQLEIPVKHNDAVEMVSMSVEKEQSRGLTEADTPWIVNLAIDLENLGPIQIRISLFKQGVSSCFWAESRKTRTLIENSFEQLRSILERHGIATLNLSCQAGSPVSDAESGSAYSNIDLLA